MSCTRPVKAEKYVCGTTGLEAIRFKAPDFKPNLELACNKCPSCKLRKAREWAVRCWHESQMHEESCNVTLTYDDEHLPPYFNLDHRDFQLFMKRLRKRTGKKISFFMCGEYGDKTHRPHYHVILYGYYPPDATYLTTRNGYRYYKSAELDKLWKCGFTDTTNVSYLNAGYIARYTLKKQLPDEETQDRYTYIDSNGDLQCRRLEYIRMSNNPAIGRSWAFKYVDDWGWKDYVLDPKGNKIPVPRYYRELLRDYICEETYKKNALARLELVQANPDNTPDRRRQKEICVDAKIKQLPRNYL